MVLAVRRGQTQRSVSRRFGVSLGHLQYWLTRTHGQQLQRVDWSDQWCVPRQHGRETNVSLQRRVLSLRQELSRGDLGFIGAQAIHDGLRSERPKAKLPSLRTIGRILKRHGALDGVRRVRRASPPAGWYLPDVAAGKAELDAFDVIEDLPLEAGPRLDVLTTRALWGSVCGAWVSAALRARWLCARLETHWRKHTVARPMPSSTMIRASKARTRIPMCWVRSSVSACRWTSPRSLRRPASTGRKISTRVSIICGRKKSGRVFTTPPPRRFRPRGIGSWRPTSNVAPAVTTRRRVEEGFPSAGS